jgi:8-oxo-dGTP diphosphatase
MPLPRSVLVATSCHSQQELLKAHTAGVLFAVLSPVLQTKTHINAKPLGWDIFESMANSCPMPVYALGGLGPKDLDQATVKAAYGVSGIRAFVDETI